MADDPLDFSSLDPTSDASRFDDRVRDIVRDGLDARRLDLFAALETWTRPALIAAAAIIAISLPSVLRPPTPPSPTIAEVLGIPQRIVDLATSTHPASLDDLAEALDLRPTHGR